MSAAISAVVRATSAAASARIKPRFDFSIGLKDTQ
jgi:hypothetical protein